MIAKVIPAKNGGRGFGTLVDYVTTETRQARPEGRDFDRLVEYVGRDTSVDPATGEAKIKAIAIETHRIRSLETAAAEMQAVAEGCTRLRAPADYHLVISWREGEVPTEEQAFAAGRHALGALGMASHQYVMAVHDDTGNRHLHVAVNRVNPDTLKAVSPFRDYLILDRAMREVELTQGWSHDRGPYAVHDGRVRLDFKEQSHGAGLDAPASVSQKARDLEAWMGAEPFTIYVRRIAEPLRELLAGDEVKWSDVHGVFARFGTELSVKGTGLLVVDANDPRTFAKASQVARFASRDRLEARLGPFEPAVERTLSYATSGMDDFRDYVRFKAGPAVRAVLGGREPSWAAVEATLGRYGLGLHPRGQRFDVFDCDEPGRRLLTTAMGRWASALGLRRAIGVAYDPERARILGDWFLADGRRALGELTKSRSTFTERQLEDWAELSTADRAQAVALKESVLEHPELVGLGIDSRARPRFTERDMFAVERRMLAYAERLARSGGFGVGAGTVDAVLARTQLAEEGRAAVSALAGDARFTALHGFAGVGKSTLLAPAREAWEKAGLRVRGLALSGLAAESLEQTSGIRSQTVASALLGWQDGYIREALREPNGAPLPAGPIREPLSARDVVVVDEANLVGSRQTERLLEHVAVAGAKVVLLGDTEQLQAIDAGGAFRVLLERLGGTSVIEVVRQREAWQRSATELLGRAQTIDALRLYEAHNRIHGFDKAEAAKTALLAQWERDRTSGTESIILASTRDDVRALSERVRARRREAGELGVDVAIETSRGARFFATNDRIRFLRNDKELDVKNGSLGTILAISPRALHVAVDDKRTVNVDLLSYDAIDWGYAATLHAAEGLTVDRAYVFLTPHADRHATYVALSRHRDGVEAYWSTQDFADRDELERTLARSGLKDTTLDYAGAGAAPGPIEPPIPEAVRPRHAREVAFRDVASSASDTPETFRRSVDPRVEHRQERAGDIARLIADYRAQGISASKLAWEEQKEREDRRRQRLDAERHAERARFMDKGLAPTVASALVAIRYAGAYVALDRAIRSERSELERYVVLERPLTWREFLIERGDSGDAVAERALRTLRYRKDGPMEKETFGVSASDGDVIGSPNARRDRTVPTGVEKDQEKEPELPGAPPTRLVYWTLDGGDVAYAFRNDSQRRALFHDRGGELLMKQQSDEAVRAAVRVAREKWGGTITLSGSDEFKETALKWAVAMNVDVANVELRQKHADLAKVIDATRVPPGKAPLLDIGGLDL